MPLENWISFVVERQDILYLRTSEHIMLAGLSTLIATIIGVSLGIAAFHFRLIRTPVLSAVGILQTVPSLALLVFLMALYGRIGILPALTALILYALLPIVRNTLTGLDGVDEAVIEAARGMGMTEYQVLKSVRLPLAAPVIIAGIRTASVVGVGVATLAAFIGAGGLGEFINRGLALSNNNLILLGAVPAAILAIAVDFILMLMEWGIKPTLTATETKLVKSRKTLVILKKLAVSTPALILVFALWFYAQSHGMGLSKGTISVGSKHTSEQLVLGEIIAQVLEAKSGLTVIRKFNFPGTMFCHQALMNGELDVYPEYTGTALCAVLHQKPILKAEDCFAAVSDQYQKRYKLKWLTPLGFDNAYVMVTRKDRAEKEGWKKISDLKSDAKKMILGASAEFVERLDGYKGFQKEYGFGFGQVKEMDSNLVYRAVDTKEIDIADAGLTDGRLTTYDLFVLEDDKNFFPPYQAAPILKESWLC